MSERERRFVEAFMGEAAGNATKAAELAGYSKKTGAQIASRLLRKVKIRAAIDAATAKAAERGIADRDARQKFWTSTMQDGEVRMADRLKASELLGKSQADFIERLEHSGEVSHIAKIVHEHHGA